MSEPLRLSVCSFQRVFDTTPVQDAMTLPELTEALQRFILKPKLAARIDKGLAEIADAEAAWRAGKNRSGRVFGKLLAAAREAKAAGRAPGEAVAERARALSHDVARDAKKDLRLWAPLLYRPGGRRETEDILHVSCLVLDYDDGTPIEEAIEVWRPWFHLIHTTWSHTPAHHKFRVVLPLAHPVAPDDFRAVFAWAEARTGFAVDPTGRGVARAYAIPATGAPDAPRRAEVRPGPLLNPALEGIVDAPSPVAVPDLEALSPCLLRRDPSVAYVPADAPPPDLDEDDPSLWDGGTVAPRPPAPEPAALAAPAGPGPAPGGDLADRLDALTARLDAVVARLEGLGRVALVDGLERLALLHDQGHLDADELRRAKARLIDP